MPSIGSILSIARTAIQSHQAAVSVAAQNVGNAQTEGYSRQRVVLSAGTPSRTEEGVFGTGVRLESVSRTRDTLLDASYRREAGRSAGFGVRQEMLLQIEAVLGEPSDHGVGAALDAFWSAWGDLSNHPTDGASRSAVRERGAQLASVLNAASAQVSAVEESLKTRLSASVDEMNRLARQVAALNVEIVAAEGGSGREAPDLRDARDRLVDRIAQLGAVRVTEQRDGAYTVTVDGETLVASSIVRTLAPPQYRDGRLVLLADGAPMTFGRDGSAIGEMLGVLNEEINGSGGIKARLDALAQGVVSRVNELHRQGWSAAGEALGGGSWGGAPTGSMVDFFDPAGVGARSIALSQAVRDDPRVIAAGYARDATSDNRLALDLAALRDAADTMDGGTRSFAVHFRETVTGIAMRADSAESSAAVHETLAAQADSRRAGVSGVSTDEELIRLMQHQQAYTAASKLLRVADEMLQALLNL